MPQTMYEKIWNAHAVREAEGEPTILYIDLHLIHEVTSPQAFAGIKRRGLSVRRPDLTVATMDHSVPSRGRFEKVWPVAAAQRQVEQLIENCREFGITLHDIASDYQGIVHVIGPELGLTQPGKTIVCGDSHTSTHGAFGALAFGIGTSEVEHVLATQCLLQNKTKTMAITVEGDLPKGVYAKDVILSIINRIGVGGGTGYTFEYRGSAISSLSMEGRMSVCNMSIESGARAGMIAPDETTIAYLRNRVSFADSKEEEETIARWLSWRSDDGAVFDREEVFDASSFEPMVTWGINPGMSVKISERIPEDAPDPDTKKAFSYMQLQPGQSMKGQRIDMAFIGSCTNARLEDLRIAARFVKGNTVASHVTAWVVPGSMQVKRAAEKEGLRDIFEDAGFEWRDPGCSVCLAMNGDRVPEGKYCASTSNRNFMGRQGPGARTFLMSPAMAAVAAIEGAIQDVREYM